MNRQPLVALNSVSKSHVMGERTVEALTDVSLDIGAGEFIGVWGPSGSGKSTLCNLIALLDVPTRGQVCFSGRDAAALTDDEASALRNRSIGIVFQRFNLISVLSALDNVALPLEMQGVGRKTAAASARRRLAEMKVERYADTRPDQLSGGEQQRVAIARALVADPTLVVADEPTANLDSAHALEIIDLMHDLNQRSGTTFVFATHDTRLLDRVKRRVMMRDGEIVEDSSQ